MANPVHKENGKWYFWDETGAGRLGPYESEDEAETALESYCNTTLSPKGTAFKHCATCKSWMEPIGDIGTCGLSKMNKVGTEPPVGGVASFTMLHTHAIFGCVNHEAN